MSLPHHPENDDVPLGGGPGAGDPMVEDVDDENIGCRADGFIDEHKFGYDEELDIGRIGEDRAHLNDEFFIPNCSDLSGRGLGGKWTEGSPEIAVNGSKRQQFKLYQKELEQVKAQGKNVSNNLARHDIMNYFYGPRSVLSLLFQRRLGWNHQKFVLFIATNWLAHTKLKPPNYSSDFPTDTSNLVDISEEGVSTSTAIGATSQTLFWKEVETEVSKLFRELLIVGRSGKMICLTDDDKIHYEWHSLHNNTIRNLSFEDATDATEDATTLGDTVVDDDTSL